MHDDSLYTQDEVAAYLKVQPRTVEAWRGKKYGPAYSRSSAGVRYRGQDVKAWVESTLVKASS
jgi:hypothetical protein